MYFTFSRTEFVSLELAKEEQEEQQHHQASFTSLPPFPSTKICHHKFSRRKCGVP